MDVFELTKKLVDLESVTGNEKACADFVEDHLRQIGFRPERQPVSAERANVFAALGRPEIVFSTHIDTVPPFIPAREDEAFIYGRGACDAKGILAAQVTAAKRLKDSGVRDFGLLFLVGEETLSDGARVADANPPGTEFLINGEPTDNLLAVGTKGILRVDIEARGRTAHSAYPELGESAIEKLLDVLEDLRRLPLPQDSVLGPTTMNIGVIEGGRASNVVPDRATAQVLFRTVVDSEGLRVRVSQVLQGRCEFEFIRSTPPLHMERLDGFETKVVAFTTDLPNLTRWGKPLLLGPGSINEAHTEHEKVSKSDLARAVDLYFSLVGQLKAKTKTA